MIIGTIVTAAHLHKTMILAQSLRRHMANCKIIVCLLEKDTPKDFKECPFFDELVLAKDLGFENFNQFIFQYNMDEGTLACKPQLMKYLLRKHPEKDYFIFMNSEMKVYNSFDDLMSLLDVYPIILTPHHINFPEEINEDLPKWYSKYGLFNSSFLAIRRHQKAEDFILWWERRCNRSCYADPNKGIYYDQKWLDFAPCYFPTFSLDHPGYNVAFWNLDERRINKDSSNSYQVNDQRLCSFNFSDHNSFLTAKINKLIPEEKALLHALLNEYHEELKNSENKNTEITEWDYNYYENGMLIDKELREKYRHSHLLQDQFPDPFQMSNVAIHSLKKRK
ncbi:hypothetical protein ACFPU1_03145 [Thalassorhabdus alkalitolerans]|uniref:Core-2/I-Branching enzyme n=1 Tax=Thalassorhabdus alkalitolerans TaxID=2282697 RepID=A0ABW0YK61_9BACI